MIRTSILSALTLTCLASAADLRAVLPDGSVRSGDPVLGGWGDFATVPGPVGESVLRDGVLWVGRPDGQVWSVDGGGNASVAFSVPGGAVVLAADGIHLLIAGSDGFVRKVDPTSGQVQESYTAPLDVVSLFSSFQAGRVAGTQSGELWREAAGTFVPFADLAGEVPVSVLEYNGQLFVATDQGNVLRVSLGGATSASYPLGAPATDMVEHLTDLLVSLDDGRLLRVDRETGQLLSETQIAATAGSLAVEQDIWLGWAYCYGDDCLCGNEDPNNGCRNSTGLGGYLLASGSASVTADDMTLVLTHMVPDGFYVMIMGQGWSHMHLGDGLLCVDVSLPFYRYPAGQVNSAGFDTLGPGLINYGHDTFHSEGHIAAGETWHFQAWYRDLQGPCGTGSNMTNAYSVTFGL